MRNEIKRDPASFRDPAANVYANDHIIIREIYPSYFPEYDLFMEKVYPELIDQELIIPHTQVHRTAEQIIIAPALVPFISYPYEWSFAMIKEAALVTLRANQVALEQGMMLKDASAYNVQYYQGRMRLIDTTSFMRYEGNTPWPAYSQFLRHFLTPLLLTKYVHTNERRLLEIYLDGIPIPYATHRLPWPAKLTGGVMSHIVAQSWAELFRDADPRKKVTMRRTALKALLDNLYHFIERLDYKPLIGTRSWIRYADAGSYQEDSLKSKKDLVAMCLDNAPKGTVLDLGANTGDYSRLAADKGNHVIAVDADHDCMFALHNTPNVLPLTVDLCNPSPGIGWANRERRAFWDRVGKVDTILALALIHHLSIRNNVPLGMIADLLAEHCNYLVIEWIPLEDRQAQRLLGAKKIPAYSKDVFLDEFSRRFTRVGISFQIRGSGRMIYRMEKN